MKTLLVWMTAAILATACASTPPHETPQVQGPPPPPGEVTAPPPQTQPTPEPGARRTERPRITLVVGGAGVASFATVGVLKRLHEEGVSVDMIVATGWPALFALGYGFLKSLHDLEWFAMRLQEKDFYRAGLFDANKEFAAHDQLSEVIQRSFKQRDLGETRIPVIISSTNTDLGDPEAYDRGDWREPLLKTMSVPGFYRPYPKGDSAWIQSLQGMDVEEALRRGNRTVVAVEMYGDYFSHVARQKADSSDSVFRRLYIGQMRKSIRRQLKLAQVVGEVSLAKGSGDFSAKRNAILAGYREGAKLARALRSLP